MYKTHQTFLLPDEDRTVVWRYTTLSRLIDILYHKRLYFRRLDHLGDHFEGQSTKKMLQDAEISLRRHLQSNRDIRELYEKKLIAYETPSDNALWRGTFVSCWHMNEHESVAMWKIYAGINSGIAIKSSIHSLKRSIDIAAEDVYIGQINYLDYELDEISGNNAFKLALSKRKIYEYEKELRLVVFDKELVSFKEHDKLGICISVEPVNLVEKIVVSPYESPEYKGAVEAIIKSFGMEIEVIDSIVNARPYQWKMSVTESNPINS